MQPGPLAAPSGRWAKPPGDQLAAGSGSVVDHATSGSASEAEAVVAGAEAAVVMMPEGAGDQAGGRLEDTNGRCRERIDGGGPKRAPGPQEVLP